MFHKKLHLSLSFRTNLIVINSHNTTETAKAKQIHDNSEPFFEMTRSCNLCVDQDVKRHPLTLHNDPKLKTTVLLKSEDTKSKFKNYSAHPYL